METSIGKLEYLRHDQKFKHFVNNLIIENSRVTLNDNTRNINLLIPKFSYFCEDEFILYDYLLKNKLVKFNMREYKNIEVKYFIKYNDVVYIKHESSYDKLKYNYITVRDDNIICNYYDDKFNLALVLIEDIYDDYKNKVIYTLQF